MTPEVLRAHATALSEWAQLYRGSTVDGASEMAFLLSRAAHLGSAMADGKVIDLEPIEVPDAPIDEPKEG